MPRLLAVAALVACALALAALLRQRPAVGAASPPPSGVEATPAPSPRAAPELAPPSVVEVTPAQRPRATGEPAPPSVIEATPSPRAAREPAPPSVVETVPRPAPRPPRPKIAWRRSLALGTPSAGRLVRAVRLPAHDAHYVTWDPVHKRVPNRWTRRNGTDGLVRTLLRVARAYARRHPGAPRILIGDLSRPRGGDFGRRFGPVGHASHQNGLDADVYFPRRDRRERAPRAVAQVDRKRAQELVDRFVEAGAEKIFVGAGLKLSGPRGVVQPWPNHDDHLHVRLRPRGP